MPVRPGWTNSICIVEPGVSVNYLNKWWNVGGAEIKRHLFYHRPLTHGHCAGILMQDLFRLLVALARSTMVICKATICEIPKLWKQNVKINEGAFNKLPKYALKREEFRENVG